MSVKLIFLTGILLGSQQLLRIRKRDMQSGSHTNSGEYTHLRSWIEYEMHCGRCVWEPSFSRSH